MALLLGGLITFLPSFSFFRLLLGIIVFFSLLLSSVFSSFFLTPLISHYGKLAIAEVVKSETTMMIQEEYGNISAMTAQYVDEQGIMQTITYRDNSRPVYPLFSRYYIPTQKGDIFVIKYLPKKQKEFIFLAELTEDERQVVCPVLKGKLSDYQAQKSSLGSERDVLKSKVYQGLTVEESDKLTRKIRRGEGLTADEQRLMVLNEKLLVLDRNMDSIQNDLIQGDRFCRE